MKPPIPKHLWHHGTCDDCKRRYTLVLHFGYDTQPERDYRICRECLSKALFYQHEEQEEYLKWKDKKVE